MEVEGFPTVDPNTNFEKILPIHQKRIHAFINHFLTNTVSFLNTFAQSCESRLMEIEYKMQKIQASILILDSQFASISSLDDSRVETSQDSNTSEQTLHKSNLDEPLDLPNVKSEEDHNAEINSSLSENPPSGPKANQDSRFVKFFKMIQFGVPVAAVKHKMIVEGLDPCILDNPNEVIPGFLTEDESDI